ncbi:MAG: adenylate/guanylate cyclase domain-containing protein, partial [Planctomycetota bacterium]
MSDYDNSHSQGLEGTLHSVVRCVLFADICDSSRFYRELGDREARRVIRRALELAGNAVEAFGGRVVDTIGDEVFCVLPDADAGLEASNRIHELVAGARTTNEIPERLGFRVGFVEGDVSLSGEQVYGDTVYLAKRVSSEAKYEETLLTQRTQRSISPVASADFRNLQRIRLKGRVDEVQLVEAIWCSADITFEGSAQIFQPPPPAVRELVLATESAQIVISSDAPSATLGRASTCELVVDDGRVSRQHARVELDGDVFVWIDQSRNGSIIHAEGSEPTAAIRSQAPLGEMGWVQ